MTNRIKSVMRLGWVDAHRKLDDRDVIPEQWRAWYVRGFDNAQATMKGNR